MANTASLDDGGRGGEVQAAPQLIVVLHASRPDDPASRHLLAGVDVAEIGRGKKRSATRSGDTVRTLRLAMADPAMSENHARLARVRGAWVLQDMGATHGCWVNGVRTPQARISDGDLIELGRTFFLFREDCVAAAGPVDAEVGEVDAPLPGLRTLSGELATIYAALAAVAPSALPITLAGATGTGKEVAAHAIHHASGRRGAFVAVNCGAIPAQLVESELFGHKRGAFSGAVADREGHVRAADGGTLFLDEIADLPLPAQAALLRVLQEREVVPVGESRPIAVDLRVIAASHADLRARVRVGEFRADLLARLDGLSVELPALVERREDFGTLTAALLARAGVTAGATPAAVRAMWNHDWPGNIRELEMTLARAVALSGRRTIELPHLPPAMQVAPREVALPSAALSSDDEELRTRLVDALTQHSGNLSAVARTLGKARWQVHRWLKRFALDPERFRAP